MISGMVILSTEISLLAMGQYVSRLVALQQARVLNALIFLAFVH